jgi:xanthine dehydrogenase accessory factor
MLIRDDGSIEGSVTGGCVEGALFEEAQAVLAGDPPRLVTYGISDDEATGVGLMCGGTVRVFVHKLGDGARESLESVGGQLAEGGPVAIATLLNGPSPGAKMVVTEDGASGSLAGPELLDTSVQRDARGFLEQGLSAIRRYSERGEVMGSDLEVYVQAFASPPSMLIFGAIDFSVAVAKLACDVGYKVTICDARSPFISSPRFSAFAEVVVDWPDRVLDGRTLGPRDAVLVFTHDPKFDQPALLSALATDVGYIGALGSRRTHRERVERLREAGIGDEQLDRIAAPCGLDIGARTPTETAISVMAEIVARRTNRGGENLSDTRGPIHAREAEFS